MGALHCCVCCPEGEVDCAQAVGDLAALRVRVLLVVHRGSLLGRQRT